MDIEKAAQALSAPAVKLIEAAEKAVGAIYEPTRIRRRAKAETDALIIKVKGEIEAAELMQRAGDRLLRQELRRQKNIESIVGKAIAELPETASEEPLGEDWVVEFFNQCQDVSDEEMQTIWAKLLAGEVAEPGTFSKRTLHTVRRLSAQEAALFQTVLGQIWVINKRFVHLFTEETEHMHFDDEKTGLSALQILTAAGLLGDSESMAFHEKEVRMAFYQGQYLVGIVKVGSGVAYVGAKHLTPAGFELTKVVKVEPDEEYLRILAESLRGEIMMRPATEKPGSENIHFDFSREVSFGFSDQEASQKGVQIARLNPNKRS